MPFPRAQAKKTVTFQRARASARGVARESLSIPHAHRPRSTVHRSFNGDARRKSAVKVLVDHPGALIILIEGAAVEIDHVRTSD